MALALDVGATFRRRFKFAALRGLFILLGGTSLVLALFG